MQNLLEKIAVRVAEAMWDYAERKYDKWAISRAYDKLGWEARHRLREAVCLEYEARRAVKRSRPANP